MKKIISILLSLIFLLGMFSINTFAATVTNVDVKGISLPESGKKPDLTAELTNSSSTHKITLVEWTEYDADWEWQRDMTANDTFKEGYWYVVYVHLQTTSNNKFDNSVTCSINGKSANISGNAVQANGTKVCCYVSYQATKTKALISSVDLTVVKPVIGKTPTFAKVDTSKYFSEKYGTVSNCSNGVTWTNQSSGVNLTVNNPFKEGVKYKVTYYLTAKDGYKFSSSTRCTINGTAATLEVKDETHIAVSLSNLVPGDGKREINSLDLSVTSPAEGAKPTYNKIDGTGYYSDNGLNGTSTRIYKNGIAWYKSSTSFISPGTTETFEGGKTYTVKISLLPKDGYKFGKNISVKINGKTATVETFDDGSINVSVTLTATKKDHVHTASTTWQTDPDNHWKICTDKNCGSLVGEKQKHSDSNKDGKCDVCGYKLPVEVPDDTTTTTTNKVDDTTTTNKADDTTKPDKNPTKPTTNNDEPADVENTENLTPDDTTEQNEDINVDDNNNDNDDNKNSVWLVIGIILVLVAGAVVVVVLMKKKKDNK